MMNLLIDKFIKSRDFEKTENKNKLVTLTGYMGLAINILLFLMKLIVGLVVNSISIVGDAINNLTDSLTNIITIFGSIMAGKPADKEHPFGHGRAEYIANLVVGIFIIILGLNLIKTSIQNIFNPQPLNVTVLTMVIMVISVLFKVYMMAYNHKAYKITQSPLNKSSVVDSRNDIIATSVVIISIGLLYFFDINIESYAGIILGAMVFLSGVDIFKDMGNLLLGQEIPEETYCKLMDILMAGKYVRGVHDIEIHQYGRDQLHGTAHLEIPINIDVYTMHTIIDELEKKAKKELNIDLSIHSDPVYFLEEDLFVRQIDRMDSNAKQR